jgi:hypothetical protein
MPPKSGIHFLSLRTNRIQIGLLMNREGEEGRLVICPAIGIWGRVYIGSFVPVKKTGGPASYIIYLKVKAKLSRFLQLKWCVPGLDSQKRK